MPGTRQRAIALVVYGFGDDVALSDKPERQKQDKNLTHKSTQDHGSNGPGFGLILSALKLRSPWCGRQRQLVNLMIR